MFNKNKAEVIIGELEGKPIGFALFFHNFSTFLGRAGIYLEDLYVTPEARGKGFGKAFLKELAKKCHYFSLVKLVCAFRFPNTLRNHF